MLFYFVCCIWKFRIACCFCRSQSRTYVDLEKPKKKKTLSATTSLVSIPNTIKLSMLNSGLLSFGKNTNYQTYTNFHVIFPNFPYRKGEAFC